MRRPIDLRRPEMTLISRGTDFGEALPARSIGRHDALGGVPIS
jgi:hypothetical protein